MARSDLFTPVHDGVLNDSMTRRTLSGDSMLRHTNAIRLLIMCVICLATAVLYLEGLSGGFLGDDLGFLHYVAGRVQADQIVSLVSNELLSPPYRSGFFYRPFAVFSFLIDYIIWGTNPVGWHLTNLLLHLANTLLLWKLVERVAAGSLNRTNMIMGGAAAAIFALRPSAPETVAWLSGRNDELVLLGFFVTLLAYLRAEGIWGRYYLLALGGFLFALGSKEAGVTMPGGLLALHIAGSVPIRQKGGESSWLPWFLHTLKGVGPFVLILLIYFLWRFLLFGSPHKVYQEVMPIELNSPVWWAAKLHALRFFLTPSLKINPLSQSFLIVTSIQLLIGLVAALRWPEARRVWLFGVCWLMAVLLPQAQQLLIAPTGEGARLLYIPGAALAVLLSAPLSTFSWPSGLLRGLRRHLFFAGTVGAIMLILLSVLLLKNLLQPWIEAGQSMKALTTAIAARASAVPEGGFAVLLIQDHFEGAIFARNGQGALMDPPVQRQSLGSRILVLTPPTAGHHAPRLALSPQQSLRLEHWCWNLKGRHFERLRLREHGPDTWLDAWKSALRESGCLALVDELEMLYH